MKNTLQESAVLQFIKAGNATFTLKSLNSGKHLTFNVKAPKGDKKGGIWFVRLLIGPDNTSNYTYMGVLTTQNALKLTAKSSLKDDSASVVGFRWMLSNLVAGHTLKNAEVWHAGKCGRCGRLLTVPESIESGYGPECIGKLGFVPVSLTKPMPVPVQPQQLSLPVMPLAPLTPSVDHEDVVMGNAFGRYEAEQEAVAHMASSMGLRYA